MSLYPFPTTITVTPRAPLKYTDYIPGISLGYPWYGTKLHFEVGLQLVDSGECGVLPGPLCLESIVPVRVLSRIQIHLLIFKAIIV